MTGASGFVGRHCLPRLADAGWEVHAVTSGPPPADGGGVVWHRGDLLEDGAAARLAAAARPTHLLHLAWHMEPGAGYDSPRNLPWVEASLELLRRATAAGARRAVLAGTCAEYDWTHSELDEETTPLAPGSVYGLCKRALSLLSEAWSRTSGLSVAWARLFFLYGPGEHPRRLVPAVARAVLRGEEARCTHGRQVRDYLYVEDAAEALVRLLASDLEGALNVASGRALELAELIRETARHAGGEELVRLGALPAPAGEPARLVASTARQTLELGFSPSTPLAEGLERSVAWWRRRLAEEARRDAGGPRP